MPAKTEFGDPKKKKKGRAPAHQNQFAFAHNPCSKKTDQILALKNVHVCQRCADKIEWRKKYRKYKPRSQPGVCNGCKKRNVKSAYHTICTNCTTESVKAKQLIREASPESEQSKQQEGLRACAICVNKVALLDPEEEGNDNDYTDAMGRMKLRERRALERKIAKEQEEAANKGKQEQLDSSDHDDDGDKVDEAIQPQGDLDDLVEEDNESDIDVDVKYDDDENDPFLKAIGGADKLLTGEAYQRKLLQQEQEAQSGS